MQDRKIVNVRMTKDLWRFLRKLAVEKDLTMTDIIISRMEKYRNKVEKKLTHKDTNV